jgi:hypothetical protein
MAWVANGTPLSVRIAIGRPYSRNVRSKTGRAVTVCVERTPRQVSRTRVC